nr:SPOR domain-containing protein [Myxococcota bacterium]
MLQQALPDAHRSLGDSAPEGHDGEYTVQVISYDSADGAHAFAAGLRVRGHRAFVMRADVEGRGTVYRVRVGPFDTMAEAQGYRRRFEETERMNVIVVRRR